ncbi:MAG TPA: hypothetical protein VGL23_04570 [Chloroflexota bacterium]
MGRGRGWSRVALVALLCCLGLLAGAGRDGAEAAPRPRITWELKAPVLPIDSCPKAAYLPQNGKNYFRVDVCPGQEVRVSGTFEPDQDVVVPRLILQTPSGARIMELDRPSLGSLIPAHTKTDFTVSVRPPPGYRNTRVSGRIYLADRGSVLVPPLFVQVAILHPTPEERALTPVVIPTNHIRVLAERFNIKQLTVVSGTNVTFTNMDLLKHRVFGALCAIPTGPNCDPLPVGPGQCDITDEEKPRLCIDSGPMDSHQTFTVRLTRPRTAPLLRYAIDDLLTSYSGCEQPPPPGGGRPRHVCYLTVK